MEQKPVKLKRFFVMVICWVVAIVSIIAGSFIYSAYKGSEYEAAAVPYVKEVVPVIALWDVNQTRELMAPEALEIIPEETFVQALQVFSRLGTLEELYEPKFEEVYEDERDPTAPRILVTYKVAARFTEGMAYFTIQLIDRGDHFQIFNFTLSSEVLTGKAQS